MISRAAGRVDASENLPPAIPALPLLNSALVDESVDTDLSSGLRADLLDFGAWGEILTTYGRTMRVAVALTNAQGQQLGECHNAQPVWRLIHEATPGRDAECPFCITIHRPCTAVADALQTGGAVIVRDEAGLSHIAVPLLLGKQCLGAIIAGQVFDRYPEPLLLRRVAREFGIPGQQIWDTARKQHPVSSAILKASGELLCVLGQAFLRQRYSAILEAKLAETNGQFRFLVEQVRDYALFTMDLAGRVTSWNGGAERMLGHLRAEIVDQNFSCIFTPEDIQNCVPSKQLHKALQAGRAEDEGWCVRKNRKQFWANINITALAEDAGPVRGFAIIIQDATERRKVAIVLEEARQERVRLQERFLSHVSHELRTPLTAIYFFTTNVLDGLFGDLAPEQREHLALALENVKQLKDMVSDLLDLTGVEAHKLAIELQPANPVKLIAEVFATCRTSAVCKKIRLDSNIAPNLPFVCADPARVRQILTNLIDNGIKFTPEDGTVTVEIRPFTEDKAFLCFSVRDTGCGISLENHDIIFGRLAQIKTDVETSRTGLGLGLFISRELVLQHGGRMWVESQLGHGSSFYFTLPVFSLAKVCAQVFTAPNLEAGCVTLIAVDMVAVEETVQADILREIRRLLERCIHPAQDVLLPSMSDVVKTFFIVACADPNGFKVIASRIGRELQNFDNASKLKPVISSTTLLVAPGQSREEQIGEVTARIEQLVQSHVLGEERFK